MHLRAEGNCVGAWEWTSRHNDSLSLGAAKSAARERRHNSTCRRGAGLPGAVRQEHFHAANQLRRRHAHRVGASDARRLTRAVKTTLQLTDGLWLVLAAEPPRLLAHSRVCP